MIWRRLVRALNGADKKHARSFRQRHELEPDGGEPGPDRGMDRLPAVDLRPLLDIADAVHSLPPIERAILRLICYGNSVEETAMTLGLPVAEVERRLAVARRHLTPLLR